MLQLTNLDTEVWESSLCCDFCGGSGVLEDEDGKHLCPECGGKGLLSEDVLHEEDLERPA